MRCSPPTSSYWPRRGSRTRWSSLLVPENRGRAVPRPVRRVEIYLPLEYNDGRPIADSKYLTLQTELRARFGGVTSTQRQFPLQGAWHFGKDVYEERVVVFTLMDFRDQTEADLLKYLK